MTRDAEIRLEIYRYLLLPNPYCLLNPLRSSCPDGNRDTVNARDLWDPDEKTHRYPSILRTNRRIHAEASSVLYKELTIIIRLEGLRYGEELQVDANRIVDTNGNGRLGQYHTTYGARSERPKWEENYRSHGLNGFMQPQIFARFHRIKLDARFNFDILDLYGSLDDPDVEITLEHLSMGPAPLMQQYMAMLSRLPVVHQLSVRMQIYLVYNWPFSNFDNQAPGEEQRNWKAEWEALRLLYDRAIVIFLDSGILDSMQRLRNVKSFDLCFRRFGSKADYPRKCLDMARDLKRTIESNCNIKNTLD